MKLLMDKLEALLEIGGTKRDITFLCISGAALILSLLKIEVFPFDIAWVPIILCGVPISISISIRLCPLYSLETPEECRRAYICKHRPDAQLFRALSSPV